MSRLIVQEFVTIDGLAAGPEGEVDFIPAATQGDSGVAENQMQFIDTIDTIVLGRGTYEMFAGYWPTATGDDKPFADKINATPKLVFSGTLERAPWGSYEDATISQGRAARRDFGCARGTARTSWSGEAFRSSARSRKPGSSTSTSSGCCPSSSAAGRPLFADGVGSIDMELFEAQPTEGGATLLRYRPRSISRRVSSRSTVARLRGDQSERRKR